MWGNTATCRGVAASYSSDDPENTPGLFFVDKGTAPWETAIVHAPRIRATTADGRQLFDLTLDRPPQQVAADNNGGLVVVLPQDYDASTGVYTPNSIRRIDGRTGNTSWQFASIGAFLGHVSDVAVHPDGRVFATEGQVTQNSLVGITPSGLVSRWSLPVGTFSQIDTGPCGLTNVAQPQPGGVTAPIIEDDGSIIVVSKVRVSTKYLSQLDPSGRSVPFRHESARLLVYRHRICQRTGP